MVEGATILIVDDDADTRSLVSSAIEAGGHTTILAENGERALEICKQMLPDLAIVDLMMPGMSGVELTKIIKSTEAGEMIPVLILTAINQMEDKISVLESGADEYLTKPFNFRELQTKVNVLLRIRALNLKLHQKNEELLAAQQKLIDQEKKLLANQLGGGAAHALGQPLTAIKLNLHLIETLPKDDDRFSKALSSTKNDVVRMTEMLEKLKTVDPAKREQYYGKTDILEIGKK